MKELIPQGQLPEATRVRIPAPVSEAVGQIVDRAKVDRKGVFWPLGVNYRQVDSARYEISLGYGNPGILLMLAEYYQCTNDRDVGELIHKSAAWIRNRTLGVPLHHGFYAGAGGLWYVWRRLEEILPGCVGSWAQDAHALVSSHGQGEALSSLGFGVAGTIIGLLSSLELSKEEGHSMMVPLLGALTAGAKFTPEGVFWDFNPTSLQAPLGFLFGNAGVDYCFAHVCRRLNISFGSLLGGSLSRSSAMFDVKMGNWPDQDGTSGMMKIDPAKIEKILECGDAARFSTAMQAEDSLGWASGLTGILLARSALAESYRGHQIGELALGDWRKGMDRLLRATDAELAALDSSLQSGLGGVALGLQSLSSRSISRTEVIDPKLLLRVEELLASRRPTIENDDLCLLTGTSGSAYSLLVTQTGHHGRNCLDPLGSEPGGEEASRPEEGALDHLLRRRLPCSIQVPEVRSALERSIICLETVKSATAGRIQESPTSVAARAIQHELGLYQVLSQTNFRRCFFREAVKRRRFALNYAEGMNDNLLFERFKVDEDVSLFELDFDPYTQSPVEQGQRLLLVRHVTSQGVLEKKLTHLQFALLSGFRDGGVTLQVIREVIQKVETPNVTQRQLAELSLKVVRAFAAAGYLVPSSQNLLGAWMLRKQLKALKNNLFPA